MAKKSRRNRGNPGTRSRGVIGDGSFGEAQIEVQHRYGTVHPVDLPIGDPQRETWEADRNRKRQSELVEQVDPTTGASTARNRPDAIDTRVNMVNDYVETGEYREWTGANELLGDTPLEPGTTAYDMIVGTREDVPHADNLVPWDGTEPSLVPGRGHAPPDGEMFMTHSADGETVPLTEAVRRSTTVIAPMSVPEIRQQMMDDLAGIMITLHGNDHMHPEHEWLRDNPDYSLESLRWLFDNLEESTMYWVSEDMCDLLQHAVTNMPETTLTADLVPEMSGLVVFAKPLIGHDARPEIVSTNDCPFQAMQWGYCSYDIPQNTRKEVALSGDDHPLFSVKGAGVSVTCWTKTNHWMPLGRSDWPYDYTTQTLFAPENWTTAQVDSINEDRKFLAAFWLLTQQDNVTDVIDQHPARHVIKRLTRKRSRQPEARVRLVDIHAPKHVKSKGHRDVEWSRRWPVRGHWRQQAVGPGRTQRRPTYIPPHVKGPDDKPFIANDVVKVWKD